MYSLKEVLEALEKESLSSALSKLEAFAISRSQNDLAQWAASEVSGYDNKAQLPKYRKVRIQWHDHNEETVLFEQRGYSKKEEAFKKPLTEGVAEVEIYSSRGLEIDSLDSEDSLEQFIQYNRQGEQVGICSGMISAETIQGLLQKIRIEARRQLQKAIPNVSATTIIQPLPDLTWMTDSKLKTILEERWKEANSAQHAGAPLATIILLGSILEGALLHKIESDPAKANLAATAPKQKDNNGKLKPKKFSAWTLNDLITVAHEAGWLGKDVNDFSMVLRDYRNLVHPGEEKKQGVLLRSDTCDVCWPVVKAALKDLSHP